MTPEQQGHYRQAYRAVLDELCSHATSRNDTLRAGALLMVLERRGAEAKSTDGPTTAGERFDVTLDVKGATPEHMVKLLQMLIAKVRGFDGKNVSLRSSTPNGKVAYTVVRWP